MLPNLFEGNMETGSALGAALQAGFKMTVSNSTSCINFTNPYITANENS